MTSEAQAIVTRLLEDDFDFKDEAVHLIRAPLTDKEFNFGWAITTSNEAVITSNAHEDAIQLNWDKINEDIGRIERNLVSACLKLDIRLRDEGHSDDALVGSGWVNGEAKGWPLIATLARMDEPMSTGSGTLPAELANTLYEGVSTEGARVIDVDFSLFDKQSIVDFLEAHPMLDS